MERTWRDELLKTGIRGKGAGFAAAFAKIGAVLTAFTFPVVLADTGTDFLLTAIVFTSLLGALVTWWFRIETAGEDGMQGMWRGAVLGSPLGLVYALPVVYADHRNAGCITHDLGLCLGPMVLAGCDLGRGVDLVLGPRRDQARTKSDRARLARSRLQLCAQAGRHHYARRCKLWAG